MACRELLQDIRSLMSPLLYREPSSLNAFTKSHLQASDFVSLYRNLLTAGQCQGSGSDMAGNA